MTLLLDGQWQPTDFRSPVGWDQLASSAGPPMPRSLMVLFIGWWAGAAKRRWSHPTSRDFCWFIALDVVQS